MANSMNGLRPCASLHRPTRGACRVEIAGGSEHLVQSVCAQQTGLLRVEGPSHARRLDERTSKNVMPLETNDEAEDQKTTSEYASWHSGGCLVGG